MIRDKVNLGSEAIYNENFQTLKKETGVDIRRWKESSCLCVSKINIVKMDILPRVTYRFNTVFIKLPMIFFTEIDFF